MKKLAFLSLFLLNIILTYSQIPLNIPTEGLIGWWPFNGNANDESGNGYNGEINGAVLTNDRFGYKNSAFEFSTNQFISIPKSSSLNIFPITISLWYNVNLLSNTQSVNLISKYSLGSWNGFGLMLGDEYYVNGSNIKSVEPMYVRNSLNKLIGHYNEPAFHQTDVSLNTWYNIVFTADSNGGKIYVNGILISSDTWTGNSGACSNDNIIKIGGKWDYWFNGKIDDVGIWNRPLNENEIKNLYNTNSTQKPLISNVNASNNLSNSTQNTSSNTTQTSNTDNKVESTSSCQLKFSRMTGMTYSFTDNREKCCLCEKSYAKYSLNSSYQKDEEILLIGELLHLHLHDATEEHKKNDIERCQKFISDNFDAMSSISFPILFSLMELHFIESTLKGGNFGQTHRKVNKYKFENKFCTNECESKCKYYGCSCK